MFGNWKCLGEAAKMRCQADEKGIYWQFLNSNSRGSGLPRSC